MLTLLLYVLIVGLVAALLFLVASAVFGRGEELGPLPEGTTVTVLPAAGIRGADVRALRFQQAFRGYKAGEVDWALSRLAARIDELEAQVAQHTPSTGSEDPPRYGPAPQQPGAGGIGPYGPATNATSTGWPGPVVDNPAPFGSAPPGFGGMPGAPGTAAPFQGIGQQPAFGTGFGGDSLASVVPVHPAGPIYPSHPFAPGNGFGTPPADPIPPGPALPGSTGPGSTSAPFGGPTTGSFAYPPAPGFRETTAPAAGVFPASADPSAGYPAPDFTASGPLPDRTPLTESGEAATDPTAAPDPGGPQAPDTPPNGDPAPDSAATGPVPRGFTAPTDTSATGSWAPPPLPGDPQPGPGGVR